MAKSPKQAIRPQPEHAALAAAKQNWKVSKKLRAIQFSDRPIFGVGSQGGHRDTATSPVAHGRAIYPNKLERLAFASQATSAQSPVMPRYPRQPRNVDVVGKRLVRKPDRRH